MQNRYLRPAVRAEFVATFVLVYLTSAIGCGQQNGALTGSSATALALATGIATSAVALAAGQRCAGWGNPLLIVALTSLGRLRAGDAALALLAQMAGGFLGALFARGLFTTDVLYLAQGGGAIADPLAGDWRLVNAQFMVGLIWIWLVLAGGGHIRPAAAATWWRLRPSGAYVAGLATTALMFAIGPISGTRCNPWSDVLGPWIAGHRGGLWVYLVPPMLAAVIAAVTLSLFWPTRRQVLPPEGSVLPPEES